MYIYTVTFIYIHICDYTYVIFIYSNVYVYYICLSFMYMYTGANLLELLGHLPSSRHAYICCSQVVIFCICIFICKCI